MSPIGSRLDGPAQAHEGPNPFPSAREQSLGVRRGATGHAWHCPAFAQSTIVSNRASFGLLEHATTSIVPVGNGCSRNGIYFPAYPLSLVTPNPMLFQAPFKTYLLRHHINAVYAL